MNGVKVGLIRLFIGVLVGFAGESIVNNGILAATGVLGNWLVAGNASVVFFFALPFAFAGFAGFAGFPPAKTE